MRVSRITSITCHIFTLLILSALPHGSLMHCLPRPAAWRSRNGGGIQGRAGLSKHACICMVCAPLLCVTILDYSVSANVGVGVGVGVCVRDRVCVCVCEAKVHQVRPASWLAHGVSPCSSRMRAGQVPPQGGQGGGILAPVSPWPHPLGLFAAALALRTHCAQCSGHRRAKLYS